MANNINDTHDDTHKDQINSESIQRFQAAIDEGLKSGEPQPFDKQAFKRRMMQTHNRPLQR